MRLFDIVPSLSSSRFSMRNATVGIVCLVVLAAALGVLTGTMPPDPLQQSVASTDSSNTPAVTTTPVPQTTDEAALSTPTATSLPDTATSTATATPIQTPIPRSMTRLRAVQAVDTTTTRATLSGTGSALTDPVMHDGGLMIVSFAHDGNAAFSVEVRDIENGSRTETLVEDIGTTGGSTAVPLPAGTYRFDITGDGDWSVDIINLSSAPQAQRVPAEAGNDGQRVIGPFRGEGFTRVTAEYSGEGDFVVYAIDESSRFDQNTIIDESGEFADQYETYMNGRYWLVVKGDGRWRLRLRASKE